MKVQLNGWYLLSLLGSVGLTIVVLSGLHLATPPLEVLQNEVHQTESSRSKLTQLPTSIPSATVITFTGDIMLGRYVERLIEMNGPEYPTAFIKHRFASSSMVVINFESAMTLPHQPTPSMTMRFSTATSSLLVLPTLKTTHASLANNHAFDYGKAGYDTTVAELASIGITAFGNPTTLSTSSIAYIDTPHGTVAVIALHTLFQEPTTAAIIATLEAATALSRLQVVYVHWGDEYELVHNAKQRDLAEKLIAAGVDLIIGHHPHVVQDIEVIDGVPVLYSLGNFIFDQYFSTEVQIGYTVDLVLSSTSQKVNLVPHTAQAKTQPRLMTETEKIGFHEALAHRSDPTLTNAIKAGLITF